MRSQLLSLAFGLTLLAPSIGIGCDDSASTDTKSAKPTAQVQKETNRTPASKGDANTESESAKDQLFRNSRFSKM